MHFPRQPLLQETCILLVVSFVKLPAMTWIYTFSLLRDLPATLVQTGVG